jgi:hypothetical protein
MERIAHVLLGDEAQDSHGTAPALRVMLRCGKCGELLSTRIEKAYELQELYSEKPPAKEAQEHAVGYQLRKEFVGEKCQNLILLEMAFDAHRRITSQRVDGGAIVSIEESS